MSTYAIKNLQDADDWAADHPGYEMRFSRARLESTDIGVSYVRLGAGARSPFGHRHRVQEEAYVVVQGSGRVKLDDEVHELSLWDAVRVAPEVARGFEGGPDGLVLIAVGGPKPEGGDGEKVDDFWPQD